MDEACSYTIKGPSYTLDVYSDPFNKRTRIDDYLGNVKDAISEAEQTAEKQVAEKLIFKGRLEHLPLFIESGYQLEAIIDGYFRGSNAYFFCKYLTQERRNSNSLMFEDTVLKEMEQKREAAAPTLPEGYKLKKADDSMCEMLSSIYREVFEVYPTPLQDPKYIKKTMGEGTIYYVVTFNGKIVSAASSEINSFYKNAEMTDCATLKDHRKYGLMKVILNKLEQELAEGGIYCAYSIARAQSYGMNASLHQLGYSYRGRLINNCYIYDKLENMNVWVKNLTAY